MAAGDFVVFDQALLDMLDKKHDFENDTFKLALVTSSVTPSATTSDPRWGAGGSTNMTTYEVTPGGNYSTGGVSLGGATTTLTGGAAYYDDGDVSIAQHASNPAGARWGFVYNSTSAGKEGVGFLDLGTTIDLSVGAFSVTWNASGIFSLNQA